MIILYCPKKIKKFFAAGKKIAQIKIASVRLRQYPNSFVEKTKWWYICAII
jgi:hypothetical protein